MHKQEMKSKADVEKLGRGQPEIVRKKKSQNIFLNMRHPEIWENGRVASDQIRKFDVLTFHSLLEIHIHCERIELKCQKEI